MDRGRNKSSFLKGYLVSAALHLILAVTSIVVLQTNAAKATKAKQVFSVTLEGGKVIGGLDLAPLDLKKKKQKSVPKITKKQKAPVKKKAKVTQKEKKKSKPKPKKITKPSAIQEEALKKKKELEEKRKKLEAKKKAKAERKAKEKAKREAEEKAKKEKEEKQKKLQERIQRAREEAENRYQGESTNAGGEGIGAAKLGKDGQGGGRLIGLEKRRYDLLLEEYVHRGWVGLYGTEQYETVVEIRLMPSGVISNARIVESSGSKIFDETVLRAVYKASPLPPPPASLYKQFYRTVRFTFRSHE